jgi:RNA polymerase sigma factor FliA
MSRKSNGSSNGSRKDILSSPSEEFVNTYTFLVRQIAEGIHRHLPRHAIDLPSLMQSGFVGLLEARQRYEPTRGVAFADYARLRIRGEIIEYLRTLDIASRSVRKMGRDLNATRAYLEQKLQRKVSSEEMAAELGMTIKSYLAAKSGADVHTVTFTNAGYFEDNNGAVNLDDIEYIPSAFFTDPATIFEKEDLAGKLALAIEKLPEILQQIVMLYHFEEMTLYEIGEVIGVTEARVSHQLTLARKFLRLILSETSDKDLSQTKPSLSEHIEDNIEDVEEALSLLLD